jgi:hypothetical protein
LEDLELFLQVEGDSSNACLGDVLVENLVLEGARFSNEKIELSEEFNYKLPLARFYWRPKQQASLQLFQVFPLYLNDSRSALVSKVLVEVPAEIQPSAWTQRGVAFLMKSFAI